MGEPPPGKSRDTHNQMVADCTRKVAARMGIPLSDERLAHLGRMAADFAWQTQGR